MKISRIISIFAVFFIYFFFYFIVFNHQAIASNCSNEEQCQNDSNCAAGEHCNKGSICADTICGGCTVMLHQWTCQGNVTPRSSSSSSSQSSSAAAQICTAGEIKYQDGMVLKCSKDTNNNRVYWGIMALYNASTCNNGSWKCENNIDFACVDNGTKWVKYGSCSTYPQCSEHNLKCEGGRLLWCRKNHINNQTYWADNGSCIEANCNVVDNINYDSSCENGERKGCVRISATNKTYLVKPPWPYCSYTGYPILPPQPGNSSSSSSQSSSAPTGICTKGTTICADGNRYSCRLDYLQNKTYWLWGGTCVFQNCDPTHDWKCEDGHNKQCYKQTTDNRTFFATFYNNSCSFSNCAPLDENQTKCENGIGYWCRKGLSPQTYWEQFSSSFCESSCTINQQKCENGIGYNCFRDNLKHTNFWVRFSPCSFEGYPAAPARPGDSSFSSSSSSQVSLSQDNVPPNPAKDVKVEFIHGNGTTIDDSIKFSWAWNGDRTCEGCEPAVGYCTYVTPTPGGSVVTGFPTGRSTGPAPFDCNPDVVGPFWWHIVNESTGQIYKQFYSGAQNIANLGLSKVRDSSGNLYPPGGTTYAVSCADDEFFNNRHNTFRIDVDTRDARGKITGQQGSTYPNVRSVKASCCFGQTMGNADCNENTDNSPIIDNGDFTIWKEEYLSTRSTKWSDFDLNGAITLLDFEIWRENKN